MLSAPDRPGSGPDDLAHEEGLRFGACTPFEKELIREDGTRVPVLIATAVLKLSPFRWITFAQDLRARDRLETLSELALSKIRPAYTVATYFAVLTTIFVVVPPMSMAWRFVPEDSTVVSGNLLALFSTLTGTLISCLPCLKVAWSPFHFHLVIARFQHDRAG